MARSSGRRATHWRNIKYGYLWWGIDYQYKDRSVHAFLCRRQRRPARDGRSQLDLVIAIYAGNYSDRAGLRVQQEYVPSFILPAVREAGD